MRQPLGSTPVISSALDRLQIRTGSGGSKGPNGNRRSFLRLPETWAEPPAEENLSFESPQIQ